MEKIQTNRNFANKLRNSCKFITGNALRDFRCGRRRSGPTVEYVRLLQGVAGSMRPSQEGKSNDMAGIGNASDGDKPLGLLYRRFTRQFDISEMFFAGDNSRTAVMEHRNQYKCAAVNTWKIIECLLKPSVMRSSRGESTSSFLTLGIKTIVIQILSLRVQNSLVVLAVHLPVEIVVVELLSSQCTTRINQTVVKSSFPKTPNPNVNNVYLGNVLIIQEKGSNEPQSCPDDSAYGGTITFEFCETIFFQSGQFMDIDSPETVQLEFHYNDGRPVKTIQVSNTGDNGVANEEYFESNVIRLKVKISGSGSIFSLSYLLCEDGAIAPTASPTGSPSATPTGLPSSDPTASPTVSPTAKPTVSPTASPTVSPTASPTVSPTSSPSDSPTSRPTEICSLDVSLTCENPVTGESCDETAPLVDLKCGCEEGVGMDILYFVYSGCGPSGATLDCGAPFVRFNLSPGALDFGPANTIPVSLLCQVLVDGSSVEEFTIDSSCDGDDGLVLQDEFGEVDGEPVLTFTGYACEPDDDGDVEEHLCFLDVEYVITICNEGAGTEVIESVILNITFSDDGSLLVLEDFGSPPVGTSLPGPENAPSNCIEVPYPSVIDVCTEREYIVTTDVAAVAPNTGIPCTGTDTIEFDSHENTLPPTGTPTVPTAPTVPTFPTVPTEPSSPTVPTAATEPTIPTVPTTPTVPTVPTAPTEPKTN